MDLVAEMLLLNLRRRGAARRRDRAASSHGASPHPAAARRGNGDRGHCGSHPQPGLGLPAMASLPVADFDLFHIVDHSYAHLATAAASGPVARDLPRPRCLSRRAPGVRGGSIVERALGRQLLEGMRAARKIVCGSPPRATRWWRPRRTRRTGRGSAKRRASPVRPAIRPRRGSRPTSLLGPAEQSCRAAARRQHDSAQARRRAAAGRRRPAPAIRAFV